MNNFEQPPNRPGGNSSDSEDAAENMRRTDDHLMQKQTLTVLWLWLLVVVFCSVAVWAFIAGYIIFASISAFLTLVFVIWIVVLARV